MTNRQLLEGVAAFKTSHGMPSDARSPVHCRWLDSGQCGGWSRLFLYLECCEHCVRLLECLLHAVRGHAPSLYKCQGQLICDLNECLWHRGVSLSARMCLSAPCCDYHYSVSQEEDARS